MSAPGAEEWQAANQRFLAAALQWLRLRMLRQASERPSGVLLPSLAPQAASPRSWLKRWLAPAAAADTVPAPRAAEPTERVSDAELAQAAEALAAAERQAEPPPALAILGQRLGLSRFERDVLLLCVAMELDTRIAALCARVQDDPSRPYPTFALALALFDDPAWDVLSPHRPLRFWRLLEITQPGAQPLTTSALRADERIVSYVKGLNHLDDRLMPLLQPFEVDGGGAELPPSQQRTVERVVGMIRDVREARLPVIQLLGSDVESKLLAAGHAASALGLHVYRLSPALLPAHAADLETLARLWQRESLLLPVALYLDQLEPEAPGAGETAASGSVPALLRRFLARTDGLLFLDVRDTAPRLSVPTVTVEVERPVPSEQEAAWTAGLGPLAEHARALAGHFNLSLASIREIAARVSARPAGSDLPGNLWEACLARTRPRLDALAQRLETKATWDELVLPADEMELLHAIVQQVRHRRTVYDDWGFRRRMNRGLGINALFAGESGTGKTMAAEVIANELRLHLYRIDLSGVVSKYIGETEKNLRTLFDAAENGGAILFFDEADALFGKRSEVRDSHDRYANIEIDYLLQRMEAYRGLAILATNMKSALDTAFMRRLRFVVTFPYPGPAERKLMWQRTFPPETPTGALDLDRLARLHLTGGSIHNIALNAAFLAAQAETPVTMALVLNAARAEFKKLERPVNEAEFRWLEPAGSAK